MVSRHRGGDRSRVIGEDGKKGNPKSSFLPESFPESAASVLGSHPQLQGRGPRKAGGGIAAPERQVSSEGSTGPGVKFTLNHVT